MPNHRLFGPLLAIVGGVAFFVISLMTWYQVDLSKISVGAKFAAQYAKQADLATSANAWEPWGFGSDILMLIVILGAIGLGVLLITGSSRAVALAGALLALGVIGTLLVLLHILSGPQPSDLVDVQPIAWLGALAAIVILVGGYLSFDYAQHSAPQQPKPKAKPQSPKQPGPQRPPSPSSRAGVWDDADFE
ncbi:MAG: hypothetical protein NTZ58_02240 [Solirubrobacterales bacterium]|nr:hypothetical protein [Solirubrobacterales bacterium]